MLCNYETSGGCVPHSRPSIGREERDAIESALCRSALTEGDEIVRFEEAMAAWVGVEHGVATHCGSAALHLSLLAMGVGANDDVIIPSYSCAALPNAIHSVAGRPVLADISLEDLNLTPETIAPRLSKRTKAIIVTHTHGVPADVAAIRRFGIPVVEDLAQSLGATWGPIRAGCQGTIAIASFYATKLMASIDGGMVLVNKKEWAEEARDLRYYGGKLGYRPRFNYKMTNLAAAIGLVQLQKLDGFVAARASIASIYDAVLAKRGVGHFPGDLAGRSRVFYRYCVLVEHRDVFLAAMRDRGIQCGRGLLEPLHRAFGEPDRDYPNASLAADRLASIPIYPSLSAGELAKVTRALDECIDQANDPASAALRFQASE